MSRIKRVILVQPESMDGNFEYVAIPRQGMLFLSAALKQWKGPFLYDTEIWFEDRGTKLDPETDLDGVDILMVTALINEAPQAYKLARLAKRCHPGLITIGGGPQMSPLPQEAINAGDFDVIVNREGEDIIGQLSDVLLTYKGANLKKFLAKVPGISFIDDVGQLVQTPRVGLVAPDFVELPDFRAIKDLTPQHPMAGGVLETVRGMYGEVHLLPGYPAVPRIPAHQERDRAKKVAPASAVGCGRPNTHFQGRPFQRFYI